MPKTIHKGNKNLDVVKNFIEYIISPLQHIIPNKGNHGEKGTLYGRGREGSVFLKINTATHTIINDVNVPKLQSSAAVEIFKNVEPKMQIIATKTAIICGVLNFLCTFFNTRGKKLSLLIAYKILVAASIKTNNTLVRPVSAPIEINPAIQPCPTELMAWAIGA